MAEVLINIDPKKAIFYDPDTNTPDTSVLVFPATADVPDGHRVKLQNRTTSTTDIIFRAQNADTIADPQEVSVFAAEHTVGIAEIILEYMAVGTQWRLTGHGDPDLAKNVLQLFTFAAYGGLELATAAVGDSLGATWDTIDQFDTAKFFTPRGVLQNVTNSSLTVTLQGIYQLSLLLSFEHNESNSGRTTYLRAYNLTDDVALGRELPIFIARNQPGTTTSIVFLLELGAALEDKEIVLQLGNGDSITGITYEALDWSFNSIGEYRGVL